MKFGRLELIEITNERRSFRRVFRCRCDCGNTVDRREDHLVSGATQSCGCLMREFASQSMRTHGEGSRSKRSDELNIYNGMKARCLNPKHKNWDRYGGRGISICARWLENYENFLADMGRRPSDKHSLERDEVNGNYEPNNCRWATAVEQQRNKTSTVLDPEIAARIRSLAASGMSKIDISRSLGVHYSSVKQITLGKQWRAA